MSFQSVSHQSDVELPTYTVCVIGDPRSGKSCFCNRFVYSHPDWYQEDHPSMLSEADFYGPVVNSDHWLYWGTVTRRLDGETSVRFCVIEQTEFLNDTTSLPFPSPKNLPVSSSASVAAVANISTLSGIAGATNCLLVPLKELHSPDRLHGYILRSTAVRICSPGKLRYYCVDQLGKGERYKQESFPHMTPLEVHGFLVIYDVSRRASCHEIPDFQQQQLSFLTDVLSLISKRKKPVVVVASKRDIVDEQCLSTVTQFLQKSTDFRKIPIVEASAHRNINVELAFLTLARLMENSGYTSKSRSTKLKLPSYQEATREQDEHQRQLREAFVNRVSLSPAGFLTDWQTFLSRYSHQGDVARYIHLWGSEVARETFEQFTAQWKTETKRRHMAKLPEVLSTFLLCVGPVTNQSPKELLQRLRAHPQFGQFFVGDESMNDGIICRHVTRQSCQVDDSRIPFALALKEPPDNGDSPFAESIKSVTFAETWATNMALCEEALLQWQADTFTDDSFSIILPGQPFDYGQLSQIYPNSDLTREDQLEIYQKFQECLRLNTREEFLDLLLESLPQFIRAASAYLKCLGNTFFTMAMSSFRQVPLAATQPRSEPNRSRPISPVSEPPTIPLRSIQLPPEDIRLCTVLAPPRGAKEQQLGIIKNRIASDRRYCAMHYMPSERQTCLTSHLDILLYRSPQLEASSPMQPPSTIQRHYSCSFVDQQDSLQLTFPSPPCPAHQTGRCMDQVFESLCNGTGWSVSETQNSFSSRLSCVLGQGDKRLFVAVSAICTDVAAANAGINLFQAAGFVPEGVTSPSLIATSSPFFRFTQNLVSSWPLASTLLTPVDTLIASLNGDSVISPVLGTVQASFLSHHELLTLATNSRQFPNIFDGVIFLLSTDDVFPPIYVSYGTNPPCTCGKFAGATYCCKCFRGASDSSHTTPRPRSFFSRGTAIKTLVDYLAPMPHLIILVGTGATTTTNVSCDITNQPNRFFSISESSPQTPIPGARLSNVLPGSSPTFSFEEREEEGKNNNVKQAPTSGEILHTVSRPQPLFVLDALSDFLSACWTRKLTSDGEERKTGGSQKTISPRARGSVKEGGDTIHESRFRFEVSPGRIQGHHCRCCHQHRYHHRHHFYRHIHHHHHHHRHHRHHFHRCSRVTTSAPGGGTFAASGTSSTSSLTSPTRRPPKLTLTPAPSSTPRRRGIRSYSLSGPSKNTLKQTQLFDWNLSEGTRPRSRSACYRKDASTFEKVSSKLPSSYATKRDDCDTVIEVTVTKSPSGLNDHSHALTSLDPLTGDCSSVASSCSPCPVASSSPTLLPFAFEKGSSTSAPESVFFSFSEGFSPLPPEGVDPATPLHVLPSMARRRYMRRNEVNRLRKLERSGDEVGKGEVGDKAESFLNVHDALQLGTVLLVPCPHTERPTFNVSKNTKSQTASYHFSMKQPPVGQKSLDLSLSNKGGLIQHHHVHHQQTPPGGSIPTAPAGGSVSSFLTSGIRAVTSGLVRPRERRRSVSTPCGGETSSSLASTNTNTTTVAGGAADTVISFSNTPSSTPSSARATDFTSSCMPPSPGTPQRADNGIGSSGGGCSTDTTSKASTPPFPFDEIEGMVEGSGSGGRLLPPRLRVASLSELMQLVSSVPTLNGGKEEASMGPKNENAKKVTVPQPRHWHLPTCPHRLCIPRQNLPPPPPSSLSSSRRHPANTTSNSNTVSSSLITPLEEYSSFKSNYHNRQHYSHYQSNTMAAPPPESRHLPADTAEQHYSTSCHRVCTQHQEQQQQQHHVGATAFSAFQSNRRSAVDLPSSSTSLDTGQDVCINAPTSSRSTMCLSTTAASTAPSRFSPPPTLVSTNSNAAITGTSGRRNKRNVLSLFSGRANVSLSEPQQHNAAIASSSVISGVCGGGGASFPSTPVHEPPAAAAAISQVALAFSHLKVTSPTRPLPNAVSSSCSSSSSSATNNANSNG